MIPARGPEGGRVFRSGPPSPSPNRSPAVTGTGTGTGSLAAPTPHTPHTPPAVSLLLINYEYPPIGGGAGTATWQIGRHLAAMRCRVAVLTSRFRDQPAFE